MITNYKDYTIKAKLTDFSRIENILVSLQATYVGLDEQTDYYFETEKGKLKYRQGTIEKLITHYERVYQDGMEKTIVYQYDKNPSEEQIQQLRATKKQIGVTNKQRKIYNLGNIKIHLDKLPNGECYLEIEAIDLVNQFSESDLKNQCLMLQSKLQIPDRDLVMTGYLKP